MRSRNSRGSDSSGDSLLLLQSGRTEVGSLLAQAVSETYDSDFLRIVKLFFLVSTLHLDHVCLWL